MRIVSLILAATACFGQSHPSWWTLAEPEATALVGIRWETLQNSAFSGAIAAEFSPGGNLNFPDLPLLSKAREILISAPDTLAIANGDFPAEAVRQQAAQKGLKSGGYRGIDLFISPQKDTLSVAQFSDQILLIGLRKTLENAIDRSLAETGRLYSPLLARAARFSADDLWIVAAQLPDPLASLFIPFDEEADGFEGGAAVGDGLQIAASIEAGSPKHASKIAEDLRQAIPSLPEVARSMEVAVEDRIVRLDLDVTAGQLNAALRSTAPAPAEKPVPSPEPAGPQVIRIYGLEGGTREIVLPPSKPEKQ